MPNIIIWGVAPSASFEGVRTKIDEVMGKLGLQKEAITTFVPAFTKNCHNEKAAPYLEVRDTDRARAMEIAKALNEALSTDVEIVVISDFFSASLDDKKE